MAARDGGRLATTAGRSMVGEHIVDATTSGSNFSRRGAEPVWKDRAHRYQVGSLDDARAAFLKATSLTVEWAKDDPSLPQARIGTGGRGSSKKMVNDFND